MTVTFRPLYDRLLVKRELEPEKTAGGIIIPDAAKKKSTEAEVLAVGKGKVQEDGTVRPLDVQVGDKVLFSQYAGTEMVIEGEKYTLLSESDVLGVRVRA